MLAVEPVHRVRVERDQQEVDERRALRRDPERKRVAEDAELQVALTGSQGSGILRSMSEANGLVVLHHEQGNVAAGEAVDVLPFDGLI
jgi:molybdopterin molybdotransferase